MTCCKRCAERATCENSIDYPLPPKEDNAATVNKDLAITELSKRLDLPLEFTIDNIDKISEILTTFKPREVNYP